MVTYIRTLLSKPILEITVLDGLVIGTVAILLVVLAIWILSR